MKPTLVVMAAGVGSRYGGLKQIDPVGPGGEIILDYSVYDAVRAGFGKVVFIIRRDIETDFKTIIGSHFAGRVQVEYVFQELTDLPAGFSVPEGRSKPWGTGQAVLSCNNAVKEPFGVINADDLYGAESYKILADYLSKLDPASNAYALVGFQLVNTLSDHGHVTRGICEVDADRMLLSVAERFKIEKTQAGARYQDKNEQWVNLRGNEIASMNMWGFTPTLFKFMEHKFPPFLKAAAGNLKAEFLMPSIADELIKERKITLKVLDTPAKWLGVTYKEDKPEVAENIRQLINRKIYPTPLWKT
ncbi:MAG: nucleotidyltransferase [Kiritimatiellia bacterium]|nr:nucleotidyltransferase [Kiritimatiellia bacterium]